jgi:cytoskeletal protein CcmA (bactofilin family)
MKPAEDSTVIGKSVTIRGEISGSEDLYVDGEIQGTVSLPANRLTVGPNAHLLADLEVRDIIVFGHIEGNIHASGRVDLRQTASIHGDIYTTRLSIEEKAMIQGRVDVGAAGPTITIPKQNPVTFHGEETPAPLFNGPQG